MVRRIKGGIKRRETDPASNKFPKCSPQPRTHFTELSREVKGEGDRNDQEKKTPNQKRREQASQ